MKCRNQKEKIKTLRAAREKRHITTRGNALRLQLGSPEEKRKAQ